jgi:hypothetical protein
MENRVGGHWPPSAGEKVAGQVAGNLAVNYPSEK